MKTKIRILLIKCLKEGHRVVEFFFIVVIRIRSKATDFICVKYNLPPDEEFLAHNLVAATGALHDDVNDSDVCLELESGHASLVEVTDVARNTFWELEENALDLVLLIALDGGRSNCMTALRRFADGRSFQFVKLLQVQNVIGHGRPGDLDATSVG